MTIVEERRELALVDAQVNAVQHLGHHRSAITIAFSNLVQFDDRGHGAESFRRVSPARDRGGRRAVPAGLPPTGRPPAPGRKQTPPRRDQVRR